LEHYIARPGGPRRGHYFRAHGWVGASICQVRERFDVLASRGCEIHELGVLALTRPKDGKPRATRKPIFSDEGVGTIAGSHGAHDRVRRAQDALRSAWRVLLGVGRDGLNTAPLRV